MFHFSLGLGEVITDALISANVVFVHKMMALALESDLQTVIGEVARDMGTNI